MTTLAPQPPGIPTGAQSKAAAPYWEACHRGELLYQRCHGCGEGNMKPARTCAACGGAKARAWGIVPLLANPARGCERDETTFEYGLLATTGSSLRDADLKSIVQARAFLWADDIVVPPVATAVSESPAS